MKQSTDRDAASALAQAARTIHREDTLEETLAAIAETARISVPGIDHAGISIVTPKGGIETKAATDPIVWEFDRLQYDLAEGPCLSTMRGTPVVSVPRARHDQRWPRFMPQALRLGLRSQLAVRLFLDDEGTMGALNLYSTSQEEIDPDAEHVAELFASHAAIALHQAREVEHLNQALESRKVIGQALGIVMERYGLDENHAFSFLLRASSTSNIKVRDIAAQLVEDTHHRHAANGS
ncbi:MAG TPA: GAF and ANTAR domain-containing protein [Nocardioides sp.]|nr:GAF and ANTAR domain-containing protein [Nocardioides sp.]